MTDDARPATAHATAARKRSAAQRALLRAEAMFADAHELDGAVLVYPHIAVCPDCRCNETEAGL